MKVKAKNKPQEKQSEEIYYGIQETHDGGIDIISTRSTVEEVESDIREYSDGESSGAEFIIVKQVKGIRVTHKTSLEEDNSMRIESDEFYQMNEGGEE